MAIFDKGIMDRIINVEGELTNNPEDKGGLTKWGISSTSYPHLSISNLTKQEALSLYEKDYWDKYRLCEIVSQAIADKLFLLIVNIGGSNAIKLIQEALYRQNRSVNIDRIMGDNTLSAINKCLYWCLIDSMTVLECEYYLEIITNIPDQEIFFKGWIRRALM